MSIAGTGFIKLYRAILNSEVFRNDALLKVWIWCLCQANFMKSYFPISTGRGSTVVKVGPGQFVFGRKVAALELGMTESGIYKRMMKLKIMGNLNIESNNKFSIITIVNWSTYQDCNDNSNSKSDKQVTHLKKLKKFKTTPLPPSGGIEEESTPEDQTPSDKSRNPKTPQTMTSELSTRFEKFWEHYPKRKSRGQAEKTWIKINPDEQLLSIMIKTIERAKSHDEQWRKDEGQFIPNPSTWLNAKGWMDQIKTDVPLSAEMPERRYFCAERDGATLYADSVPDPRTIKPEPVTI
jgi:hypothetical protein